MSFGKKPFALHAWGAFDDPSRKPRALVANAPIVVNGDTVRDENGNLVEAADPVDEEVRFFITTRAGSFFGDGTIGNGVFRVRVLTPRSLVAIRDLATRALKPMVDRGDITDVDVAPSPLVRNGTAINLYDVTYRKLNTVRR